MKNAWKNGLQMQTLITLYKGKNGLNFAYSKILLSPLDMILLGMVCATFQYVEKIYCSNFRANIMNNIEVSESVKLQVLWT